MLNRAGKLNCDLTSREVNNNRKLSHAGRALLKRQPRNLDYRRAPGTGCFALGGPSPTWPGRELSRTNICPRLPESGTTGIRGYLGRPYFRRLGGGFNAQHLTTLRRFPTLDSVCAHRCTVSHNGAKCAIPIRKLGLPPDGNQDRPARAGALANMITASSSAVNVSRCAPVNSCS